MAAVAEFLYICFMKTIRRLLVIMSLLPVLGCCSSKNLTPADPPDKEDPEEPEEVVSLTVKAVPKWDRSLDGKGLSFSSGDEIGVYCINATGSSQYNVPFRTEDGVTFTQPDGKTLNFDKNTEVYAYYPYVKDAIRTLVRDVRVPSEQNGGESLKSRLFYAARGGVEGSVATLSFIPVQSVVDFTIHNGSGKDISLSSVSIEFGGPASGIFRHDLSADPSAGDFSLSPMTGTSGQKVALSGENVYALPKGGDLTFTAVVAPLSSATVRLQGYAGEGEYWSSETSFSGGFKAGSLESLGFSLTPDSYNLDIYDLIESMNLLANGDYSVPEKYRGRMRQASGVQNLRDFGGIALEDGGTTAYGVIFRSAALEDIKADGKAYMTGTLGIKTDIDLRNPETGEAKGYSPLGEGVNYFNRLGPWYVVGEDGIKEGNKRGNLLDVLRVFSNKANYPIDFHCQVGRDRTGTVGAVLAALAGATRKAFYEDYLISFYAECCHSGGYTASGMAGNIIQLYDFLSSYKSPDLSLSANAEAFLLDLGLTAAQVGTLKEILLTGDITVKETENPTMDGGGVEGISSSTLE